MNEWLNSWRSEIGVKPSRLLGYNLRGDRECPALGGYAIVDTVKYSSIDSISLSDDVPNDVPCMHLSPKNVKHEYAMPHVWHDCVVPSPPSKYSRWYRPCPISPPPFLPSGYLHIHTVDTPCHPRKRCQCRSQSTSILTQTTTTKE